ncbi:MAG: MFS transporter [Pirellulales bacterium]|nr:MFS transporter [Pirellulales bacterium]
MSEGTAEPETLTPIGRIVILTTAFLGWLFAGQVMAIFPLAGRAAAVSLGAENEGAAGGWIAYYIAAFLLGAALGGLVFGWLGDRFGRARAMGLSILWYTLWTGGTYFVTSSEQLVVMRFIACLGTGGIWPNGVALASEAWASVSKPLMAGLIGTAANVGFIGLSMLASHWTITPENWRWVLIAGAIPAPLGLFAMFFVPESPDWLATRRNPPPVKPRSPMSELFRPPLLSHTLIGICLGAIPILGNWGGANWLVPWAGKVASATTTSAVEGAVDPRAVEGWTQASKSAGGALGSLLGGWMATLFGRRTSYFLITLGSLATSMYLFRYLDPLAPLFLWWVFALGFFGTVYFGWLPLYLPELFPTRVRSTGSGVTFNFGRILSVGGVMGTGALLRAFDGDYARVGQITCLVYVLGLVLICFAPDTTRRAFSD